MAERYRKEHVLYVAHKHAYDALEARKKDAFNQVKLGMRDLLNVYKDLVAHMPALRNKLSRLNINPAIYEDLYKRLTNALYSAISGLSFVATPKSKLADRDALRADYLKKQQALMTALERFDKMAINLFERLKRIPRWKDRLDEYIAHVKQASAAQIMNNLERLRGVLVSKNMHDDYLLLDRVCSYYKNTLQRRFGALEAARKRLEKIPSDISVAHYLDTGFRALGGVEKIASEFFEKLNSLDRVWEETGRLQNGRYFRDLSIYADLHKLIPQGSDKLCEQLRSKIHLAIQDADNLVDSFNKLQELSRQHIVRAA